MKCMQTNKRKRIGVMCRPALLSHLPYGHTTRICGGHYNWPHKCKQISDHGMQIDVNTIDLNRNPANAYDRFDTDFPIEKLAEIIRIRCFIPNAVQCYFDSENTFVREGVPYIHRTVPSSNGDLINKKKTGFQPNKITPENLRSLHFV